MAARLSYEYGVPYKTFIEMSPMDWKMHIEVLKDLAKEQKRGNRRIKRH